MISLIRIKNKKRVHTPNEYLSINGRQFKRGLALFTKVFDNENAISVNRVKNEKLYDND